LAVLLIIGRVTKNFNFKILLRNFVEGIVLLVLNKECNVE